MLNRGKLVILLILAVAVAAAAFSVWFHYQGGQRSRDFWTARAALLIIDAPEVEALRVEADPAEADGPEMSVDSLDPSLPDTRAWNIITGHDVSQAPGIKNIRHALVQDAAFDWSGRPPIERPNWQYGLKFNDGNSQATVLFDFETRRVMLSGAKRTVLLDRAANDDWRQFFAEQFAGDFEQTEAAKPVDQQATNKGDEEANKDSAHQSDEKATDKAVDQSPSNESRGADENATPADHPARP